MAERERTSTGTAKDQMENRIRINNMINEGGLGLMGNYFHNEENRVLAEEKIKQDKQNNNQILH